jgi:hypothetical protein
VSQCDMDFQSIPLHIVYCSQHFEPIQCVNNLSRSLTTFQINDPKVTMILDDFPLLSKLVVQQLFTQLSQLVTHFIRINFFILH